MNRYEDSKQDKIEDKKNKYKNIRLISLIVIVVFGLVSILLPQYLNNLKNKKELEEQINNTKPIIIKNDYSNAFYQSDNFQLPNQFKGNEVINKDNKYYINNNKEMFYFEENITLTKEDKELYLYNNIQLYAKYMQSLIDRHEIKDSKNYLQIDEFYNDNLSFYAIGYEEEGFYKYIVFNIYDVEQVKKLSYAYIQVLPTDTEFFKNKNVGIDEHKEFLEQIFKKYNR